jgi:hypothetical protein
MMPWPVPMCVYCNKRSTIPGAAVCQQCAEKKDPEPEPQRWSGPPCDSAGDHGDCIRWCRVAYTKESYK